MRPVIMRGASMVPPRDSGRKAREKLRRQSMRSMTQSSSPSHWPVKIPFASMVWSLSTVRQYTRSSGDGTISLFAIRSAITAPPVLTGRESPSFSSSALTFRR